MRGMRPSTVLRSGLLVVTALAAASPASAREPLAAAQLARVDEAVTSVLASTGAPGASVAVVWEGKIAYEKAYGLGRLAPDTPATTAMRYSIGSVSKQFTATAVLLLAEEGRLSLDDKVGRWLPELVRANDVSVRQLLSMTAGYQDYWPHDYVFPAMLEPISAMALLDRWAKKPLDFEPGTKWQYSNTNYVVAGQIVERVSGKPLVDFLRERVFAKLGMTSVKDADASPLGPGDAAAYLRNAVGPLRPAPKEAPGWLSAAGELAMTAHDLALWDISVIDETVLRPASYRTMQTDVLLASGAATGYGLGVDVRTVNGRRQISHGGAVSGYLTANVVYPDERTAVVVLTNIYPGATGADYRMADSIERVVFEAEDVEATRALQQARGVFAGLQSGKIDRSLFSPNANAYFTEQAVADFAASLSPLGTPTEFVQTGGNVRGGMAFRAFRIKGGGRTLKLTTRTLPDGKLEQYLVESVEGPAPGQPAGASYDEGKVPAYTLPDPLRFADGSPVREARDWTEKRRAEVLELFRAHVYGRSPAPPPGMRSVVVATDARALDGLATRRQVRVLLDGTETGPSFEILLYVPNGATKPVPAFLGLNFGGNQTVHADPGIRLSAAWMREGPAVVDHRATEASRGSAAASWPVERILDRGYALATVYYGDIEPDHPEGWKDGVRARIGPGTTGRFAPDDWGAIGAWAWGLSRALDLLAKDPDIDGGRVAVIGHSRLGKTALWAGAQDERFAMVVSNDSGEGGAALARRRFGETTERITTVFPHWFCARLREYASREDDLPVDQHELLALVAPRPVYVASATEDLWADPRGEFLAAKAAEPVFRLFGLGGLGVAGQPAPDRPVGGSIGYHLRTGPHALAAYDWEQYLDFADRHLRPGP